MGSANNARLKFSPETRSTSSTMLIPIALAVSLICIIAAFYVEHATEQRQQKTWGKSQSPDAWKKELRVSDGTFGDRWSGLDHPAGKRK